MARVMECEECGASIEHLHPNSRFCSDDHKWKYNDRKKSARMRAKRFMGHKNGYNGAQPAKVAKLRELQGDHYGTGTVSPALVAYCNAILQAEFRDLDE